MLTTLVKHHVRNIFPQIDDTRRDMPDMLLIGDAVNARTRAHLVHCNKLCHGAICRGVKNLNHTENDDKKYLIQGHVKFCLMYNYSIFKMNLVNLQASWHIFGCFNCAIHGQKS